MELFFSWQYRLIRDFASSNHRHSLPTTFTSGATHMTLDQQLSPTNVCYQQQKVLIQ